MPKNRSFDSIEEAMRYRMRHGITQGKLAEMTGLHYRTIAEAMHGRSEVTPKNLAKLGITRKSVYVVANDLDAGQGHSMHTPRNTCPTPEQRAERLARIAAEKLERQNRPKAHPQRQVHELSNERILVAVKFKLNPLITWQTFIQGKPKGDIDAAWQAYCAEIGQKPPEKLTVPIKAEPVLYGHLKPVDRGEDHRRPLNRGELPKITPHYQPEVTQSSIIERTED